jgi:hypothetical protein
VKLFEGPYYDGTAGNNTNRVYDVSRDGRFLMIKEPRSPDGQSPPHIVVVQNWLDELRRTVR